MAFIHLRGYDTRFRHFKTVIVAAYRTQNNRAYKNDFPFQVIRSLNEEKKARGLGRIRRRELHLLQSAQRVHNSSLCISNIFYNVHICNINQSWLFGYVSTVWMNVKFQSTM